MEKTKIGLHSKLEILERIDQYVKMLAEINPKSRMTHGIDWKGRKFIRITYRFSGQRSVHSFIDLSNGDILKAASWSQPAKNGVRGNIFSDDLGRSVVDECTTIYLTK